MSVSVDDPNMVDWLAVEFVCGGTRMQLGEDSDTLSAAIQTIGYRLTVAQIAERCGTTERQVLRLLKRAGAENCPFCHRNLLIGADRILPYHSLSTGRTCRMSGYLITDLNRCAEVREDCRVVSRIR